MLKALESGASDVSTEDTMYVVRTEYADLYGVKDKMEAAGIKIHEVSVNMIPQNTVQLTGSAAMSMLKLMQGLEEQDDVQNVYANFDIADEIMEQFEG